MRRVMAIGGFALVAVGIGAVSPATIGAQTQVACIEHPTFADSTGLTLRGAAATTGGVLRLTPATGSVVGAAFSTTALDLVDSRGLDTTFQFRITEPGGILDGDGQTGADGFALVFATASDAPTGSAGGGIGYEGIPNSVAVEFDTFANKPGAPLEGINDPNGNHVGVHTKGQNPNSVAEADALAVSTSIPNMSDGAAHTARVVYQPPSGVTPGLRVFVDNVTTPVLTLATFNMATTINLNAGRGFLGFTASTGAAWENHDILSWSACTVVPAGVTSTTVGGTTTTAAPGSTTTTTAAAVTTTTAAVTTTTVAAAVGGTGTAAAVTTTTRAPTPLPRTGAGTGRLAVWAAFAMALGALMVLRYRGLQEPASNTASFGPTRFPASDGDGGNPGAVSRAPLDEAALDALREMDTD